MFSYKMISSYFSPPTKDKSKEHTSYTDIAVQAKKAVDKYAADLVGKTDVPGKTQCPVCLQRFRTGDEFQRHRKAFVANCKHATLFVCIVVMVACLIGWIRAQ